MGLLGVGQPVLHGWPAAGQSLLRWMRSVQGGAAMPCCSDPGGCNRSTLKMVHSSKSDSSLRRCSRTVAPTLPSFVK